MFGWIIAGAVALATSIVCGCLSEGERQQQKKMVKDYNTYCEKQKENLKEYKKRVEEEAEINWLANEERIRKLKEAAHKKYRQLNEQWFDRTMKQLNDHRRLKREQYDQLCKALEQSKEFSENTQSTDIRSSSMKIEIIQLEEAVRILTAYETYLDEYESKLQNALSEDALLPNVFSMTLPEDYPYEGKVYNVEAEQIHTSSNGWKYITPRAGIMLNLMKNRNDDSADTMDYLLLKKNPELKSFPMMVMPERNGKAPSLVSVARGMLWQSAKSCEPVVTEVFKVSETRALTLSYYGAKGKLSPRDRKNPNRAAPAGSKKKVFVKEHDYLFNKITFSEKYEEALRPECFDRLPFIITQEGYAELKKRVTELGVKGSEAEWHIGPVVEGSCDIVKLQLGRSYGLLCEFVKASEAVSLRHIRMLNEEEFLKPDEIFAVVDISLCAKRDYQYTQNDIDECSRLYLFLNREFEMQRALSRSSEMSVYFDKWQKLTERLKDYKSCTSSVDIMPYNWIESIRNKNLLTAFHLTETKELKEYAELQDSVQARFSLNYISESKYERKIPCTISHLGNGCYEIIPRRPVTLTDLKDNDYTLKLRENVRATAELRQLAAFHDFKNGKCSSIHLKKKILSTEKIDFVDSGIRVESFFNNNIAANESQSYSVAAALRSADFYIIQGPPGTGKTTVIKELVLQTIYHDSKARILVVSQANVAVDNVLRGLLNMQDKIVPSELIVRCGDSEKIAPDISEKCGIDGYRASYLEDLEKSCAFSAERALWRDIINKKENNGLLMEMMLKRFQIVGVTCVGLSNSMYGLSNNDFDLVIIDEAGKALPGELLIPINHAKKLVIIGDHKQLPPVIDSELYEGGNVETEDVVDKDERVDFFNKSFFERLWDKCPDFNKHMLNTQFRMPSVISGLVNIFYDGQLLDGECCALKRPMILGSHLIFIDMKDVKDYHEYEKENGKKTGPYNPVEALAVVEIAKKVSRYYDRRLVVITPYKKQKRKIITALKEDDIDKGKVSVDTIDAFQGDEEDIVIFCTTRSRKVTEFFGDDARLNVAFSRARNTLMIIGDSRYFAKYEEGQKIREVDKYLKQHAKTVPYKEFVFPEFELAFDPGHAVATIQPGSKETFFPENVNGLIDKLVVPLSVKRECEKCGKELQEDEDELCFTCRMNSEIIEPLKLPGIKVGVCPKCGNDIRMNKEQLAKNDGKPFDLCWNCSNKEVTIGSCQRCRKEIRMPEWKRRKYYKDKKIILCNNCRNAQYYSVGKSVGDRSMDTFFSGDIVSLNVQWISGSISVYTHESKDIVLRETVQEGIGNPLKLYAEQDDDELFVEFFSKSINNVKECLRKELEILIPKKNVLNSISIECNSADIEMNLSEISSCNMDIQTNSGNVILNLSERSSCKADINVNSGDITLKMPKTSSCEADINTNSGNVTLGLPSNLSFKTRIYISSGDIDSDFKLTEEDDCFMCGKGKVKVNVNVNSGYVEIRSND